MDFKQLEAFVQVVNTRSFSGAAKALFLTQPTISAHIRSLEREHNQKLIRRTAKEALPTESGTLLYDYAVRMLALRDEATANLRGEAPCAHVVVTVAASTIPHQYVLPEMMQAFRRQHPDITFHIQSGDSGEVVEAVRSGRAEIGMTGTAMETPGCTFKAFLDDSLVVVTPNAPPYTEMEPSGFRIEDLLTSPFISREEGSGTRMETERYLERLGLHYKDLNHIAFMDDQDAIKSAVGRGLGIAIMSELATADYARFGVVRTFPLRGEAIVRKLYFVARTGRTPSPAANNFIAFTMAHYDKSGAKQ